MLTTKFVHGRTYSRIVRRDGTPIGHIVKKFRNEHRGRIYGLEYVFLPISKFENRVVRGKSIKDVIAQISVRK